MGLPRVAEDVTVFDLDLCVEVGVNIDNLFVLSLHMRSLPSRFLTFFC
jgi:hypothetical protein